MVLRNPRPDYGISVTLHNDAWSKRSFIQTYSGNYCDVFCLGIYIRSFGDFFDLRRNKPLSKQWWGWWFEAPSRPLWRHCNGCNQFVQVQSEHQSSTLLAFVRGIHLWPMNSLHKGPVTRKMLPFDDVIMNKRSQMHNRGVLYQLLPHNSCYIIWPLI